MKFSKTRITSTFTPTIDATPDYAAGDSLATDPIEITIGGDVSPTGVIQSVAVTDKANQKPALTLLFFRGAPAGGTYTKNGQLALSAADRALFIGKMEVASGNWQTLATGIEAVATVLGPLPFAAKPNVGTAAAGSTPVPAAAKLYCIPVVQGAYNAGAADDLTFTFGLILD